MQRLTRLRERPERGATAAIVAITMMVLLGFTALGVDVTAAYAKSQEVQNAADAAAFAAAQECASRARCETRGIRGDIQSIAERLATNNLRTEWDEVDVEPDENKGQVTVEVTAQHRNFFASAFGADTFTISRSATAGWGSPTRITTTLPLIIGECEFDQLRIDSGEIFVFNLSKTSRVNCIYPNSRNLMPGGFGYINGGRCGDITVDLYSNGGWVASRNGNNPPDCNHSMMQQMIDNNDVVLVPIFDECRGGNGNGNSPNERCQRGNPQGYHVKGFAAVELHGIKFGGNGHGLTYPNSGPSRMTNYCSGNERCLRGKFVRWVDVDDAAEWGAAPNFGVSTVRLVEPVDGQNCGRGGC